MSNIFNELVTGFSTRMNCPCTMLKGECQAILTVEALQFHIGFLEASGMLIIQTGLSEVPEQNREEFLMLLLAANNLYSGTGGLCIGIDAEQETVTLQLAWEIEHLNGERFDSLMMNMLNGVVLVMERIMTWVPQAAQLSDSPTESMTANKVTNFLKV